MKTSFAYNTFEVLLIVVALFVSMLLLFPYIDLGGLSASQRAKASEERSLDAHYESQNGLRPSNSLRSYPSSANYAKQQNSEIPSLAKKSDDNAKGLEEIEDLLKTK